MPEAGAAEEVSIAGLETVASATLRGLEATRYGELRRLYDDRSRVEGKTWEKTAQGRRVRAALSRLIAEARTVTTVDPEAPDGPHVLNYTGIDGKIIRFTSIVASNVESDPSIRADIGGIVARFIAEYAAKDGLFLYDVSSPEREAFEKGITAAQQGNYSGALDFFKEARQIAPYAADLYYNAGLAESMIKGRELRAISWFGAYLASKPGAANTASVKARIAKLKTRSEDMIRGLLQLSEDTAKEFTRAYNHDNALYRTALPWAKFGNAEAVERIAGLIPDPDQQSYTLRKLAQVHLEQGDLPAAEQAVESIQDLFTKCQARVEIAEAKRKSGDAAGAQGSLAWVKENIKLVEDAYYRSIVLTSVAEVQIKLGDTAAARETLAESKKSNALYSLCFSVADAYCLIAEAETHAGDLDAAEETFALAEETIKSLQDKALYVKIAIARAKTGNIAAAIEASERIEDPAGWSADFALRAIVEAQVKAGDLTAAQNTADKLSNIFKKKSQLLIDEARAKPGIKPMDWIINLDDSDFLAGETFTDIAGYVKSLALSDDPSHNFEVVLARAESWLEGHQTVIRMLGNLEEL